MKKSIKTFLLGVAMIMAFALLANFSASTTASAKKANKKSTKVSKSKKKASKKVTIKKLSVSAPSGKTAYIAKGKKIKLITEVAAKPDKKANKKVTLKSANKKIAAVKKGYIVAKKVGKTKVTVTSSVNPKKKKSIKVVVKKGAVKKITLNKNKAALFEGDTLKLKASVKATKSASKILHWYSSNQAVASVSKNGEVFVKTSGTATIYVESTDGTNKKAKCVITATAKYSIENVTVLTSNQIRIKLNKPVVLNENDFEVKAKLSLKGEYNKVLKIKKITNNFDNLTYDIMVATKDTNNSYYYDTISEGEYIKVTINKLNGIKEYECKREYYKHQRTVFSGKVGSSLSGTIYINGTTVGYIRDLKVTNLPEGLTPTYYSNYVSFTGKPTKVQNGTVVTLSGTDENGVVHKTETVFYIGSSDKIVTYSSSPTIMHTTDEQCSETNYVYIYGVGGSGKYTISADNIPESIKPFVRVYNSTSNSPEFDIYSAISEYNSKTDIYDYKYLAPGEYKIPVTLTDENGLTASYVYSFTVVKGVKIYGVVKRENGEGLTDKYVYTSFTNPENKYKSISSVGTKSKDEKNGTKDGEYFIYVYPNIRYDLYTSSGGIEIYNYGVTPTTVPMRKDFVFKGSKINFEHPDYIGSMYDRVNYGNTSSASDYSEINVDSYDGVFLPNGTYEYFRTYNNIDYHTKFTVNGKDMTVKIEDKPKDGYAYVKVVDQDGNPLSSVSLKDADVYTDYYVVSRGLMSVPLNTSIKIYKESTFYYTNRTEKKVYTSEPFTASSDSIITVVVNVETTSTPR